MSEAPFLWTEYMKEALKMAKKAALQREIPIGAVVVFKEKVVGWGYNLRESGKSPLLHAEIIALTEASESLKRWRLLECTLVVTLEPCLMCLAAAQQARVSQVVYGVKDQKGGALSLGYRFHEDKRMHHRFPVAHLNFAECGKILTNFFESRRKI